MSFSEIILVLPVLQSGFIIYLEFGRSGLLKNILKSEAWHREWPQHYYPRVNLANAAVEVSPPAVTLPAVALPPSFVWKAGKLEMNLWI